MPSRPHPRSQTPPPPRGRPGRHLARALLAVATLVGCSPAAPTATDAGRDDLDDLGGAPLEPLSLTAMTFNTGSGPELSHDAPPDDGFGRREAEWSDLYYGNGLAFERFIEDTRRFVAGAAPDVVAFQEIFHPEDCADVPAEARVGFICEDWQRGDATVAQRVLMDDEGDASGWQVACHPGKPDKCLAVRRSLGTIRGCDGDVCLEALDGWSIEGCGSGARVARAVVDLTTGGTLTVVSIHSSSGLSQEDAACRVAQIERVFVDLGDGQPAANGTRNLILGDLNTDPGRMAEADPSAARWLDFAAAEPGRAGFHFVTTIGADAPRAYAGLFDIDHVVSDVLDGPCWHAGVTPGRPPVTDAVFFDHRPAVCALAE